MAANGMKTHTINVIEYHPIWRSVAEVVAGVKRRGGQIMTDSELVMGWIARYNYHPIIVSVSHETKNSKAKIAFLARDRSENHILLSKLPYKECKRPVQESSLYREIAEWFEGEMEEDGMFAVAVGLG